MDGLLGQPPCLDQVGIIIMTKFVRLAALTAAATLAATPAIAAAPVTTQGEAKAKILKALTLSADEPLDFGTIVVGAVVGTETVTITADAAGNRTCGLAVGSQLVCNADPHQAAKFNVTGSNGQLVTITSPATVTMDNGATGTLVVRLTDPADLTLTNSGAPGADFYIGGEVDLAAATEEGDYSGDFDVTVEY